MKSSIYKLFAVNLVCLSTTALLCSDSVFANEDENWREIISGATYYEIGGDSRIPRRRNRNVPLRGGVEWENNVMCGNFDRSLSVTNILNGVTADLMKVKEDLVNSMTGVISSAPWLILARTDPQLYEVLREGRIGADQLFTASVASCEEVTEDIMASGDEKASEWVRVSGFEQWQRESEDPDDKDLVELNENIRANRGNQGVRMPSGNVGGAGQEPINVDREAVLAGSNSLIGREPTDQSAWPTPSTNPNAATPDNSPWYAEYWSSPSEIAEWLERVVGTVELRTCNDCERIVTRPGKGIYAVIEEEQEIIAAALTALVEHRTALYQPEQLRAVSAPGFEIKSEVIEALKPETVQREAFINLLAEEVALTRNVERLIAMRRILYAGKRNAYIDRYRPATDVINSRISELAKEMDIIKEDYEFRSLVKGSVARQLLLRLERDRAGRPAERDSNMQEILYRLQELSQ